MYSIATGMMPAPMIAATQAPGRLARREAHQHRARALGRAQDAHGRLGDDAELPLRADDEAEQVVARASRCVAADVDDAAVHHHERTPSRLLVVTPYFRQCAPPEFMAMLPAIVQASWLDGSGA